MLAEKTLTEEPTAVIHSVAPIRICDNGSWTDTWFAGHGQVFNVAVSPFAEVQVAAYPARDHAPAILLHPRNLGPAYEVNRQGPPWGEHPLLEAAVASMSLPEGQRVAISIHSEAPPGAGTGTSAAVTVALLGALDALRGGAMTAAEVAAAAHRVETVMLGRQCGIQDQLASAHGGINYIEMSAYPQAFVSPVRVSDSIWSEFERRLLLIYLGKGHDSSALHEGVIRALEAAGPGSPALADLRGKAARSRDALVAGDFEALGRVMTESTEAQSRLHPDLVGAEAREVIEIAKAHRALGFKVNGAGGGGGSLTLLCGDDASDVLVRAIEKASSTFRSIPIRLSRHGLRVFREDWLPETSPRRP